MYDDFHRCHDPHRRMNPPFVGDVDTTQIGGIYDVQHTHGHHDCSPGYHIPCVPPLPPTFPCMTESEQLRSLSVKVNELCELVMGQNEKVEDAYNSIVNSALCNSAYYKDITTEYGYISESGANYTVVHIPFVDKANEPIYFELGLAYDNTTNSGVQEECFSASERFLADKLIPAQNRDTSFAGSVVWKGAPIYSSVGYTFGVTQNGFFKSYKSVTPDVLRADKIRNACGARGVLVYNKAIASDQFPTDGGTMMSRVAVGQNYDTKERFIIVVDGGVTTGCTSEQLAKIFVKYGCMIAVELASGTSAYGMDKGAMMYAPSVASMDETPSIPKSNAFWYITKRRHYHNDYVTDVARLTQEVGQEIWRRNILNIQTDYIKSRVVELANQLEQEISDRQTADMQLDAKYSAEISRLDAKCDKIETDSKQRDNKLTELIETKERESQERDTQLQTNINNEATVREEQDVKKIAHVDDGDKRTYSIYRNDGTKIEENIEVYEYNKLVAQLHTLGLVEANLNAEIENRKKADDALQAQITQEISDRRDANTALENKIDTEIADRKAADNEINTALSAETSARKSDVATLTTNVTENTAKIAQEISDRKSGDSALNALIEAEQTARENKDNELAASIRDLKTDYDNFKSDTTADLSSKKLQIDAINQDIANIKTVLDTQSTQMSSINATITAVQTTISTMETSLENMKQSLAAMQSSLTIYSEKVDKEISDRQTQYALLLEKVTNIEQKTDETSWVNKYRTLIEKIAAEM